jgi:chromosome segregation ATPase
MPPKSKSTSSGDESLTIEAINRLFEKHLKPVDNKLESLQSSIHKLETRLSSFESEQKQQGEALTFLSNEVDDINSELMQIKGEMENSNVAMIKESIAQIQHDVRARSVELYGIPARPGEDLPEVIPKIAKKLKLMTTLNDVDKIYRIKQSKRIVIRFLQTHKRDQFFAGCRKDTRT